MKASALHEPTGVTRLKRQSYHDGDRIATLKAGMETTARGIRKSFKGGSFLCFAYRRYRTIYTFQNSPNYTREMDVSFYVK